jgi:hypothetical protein
VEHGKNEGEECKGFINTVAQKRTIVHVEVTKNARTNSVTLLIPARNSDLSV